MLKKIVNKNLCRLLSELSDKSVAVSLEKNRVCRRLKTVVEQELEAISSGSNKKSYDLKVAYYYLWLVDLDFEQLKKKSDFNTSTHTIELKPMPAKVSNWFLKLIDIDDDRWYEVSFKLTGANVHGFHVPIVSEKLIISIIYNLCKEKPEYLLTKSKDRLSALGDKLFSYAKVIDFVNKVDIYNAGCIVRLFIESGMLMVMVHSELERRSGLNGITVLLEYIYELGLWVPLVGDASSVKGVDSYDLVCRQFVKDKVISAEQLIVNLLCVNGLLGFVSKHKGQARAQLRFIKYTLQSMVTEVVASFIENASKEDVMEFFKQAPDAFVAYVLNNNNTLPSWLEECFLSNFAQDLSLVIAAMQYYYLVLHASDFKGACFYATDYYMRGFKQDENADVVYPRLVSSCRVLNESLKKKADIAESFRQIFESFPKLPIYMRKHDESLLRSILTKYPSSVGGITDLKVIVKILLDALHSRHAYEQAVELGKYLRGHVWDHDRMAIIISQFNIKSFSYLMPIYLLLRGAIGDPNLLESICIGDHSRCGLIGFTRLFFQFYALCVPGHDFVSKPRGLNVKKLWDNLFLPILKYLSSIVDVTDVDVTDDYFAAIFRINIERMMKFFSQNFKCLPSTQEFFITPNRGIPLELIRVILNSAELAKNEVSVERDHDLLDLMVDFFKDTDMRRFIETCCEEMTDVLAVSETEVFSNSFDAGSASDSSEEEVFECLSL